MKICTYCNREVSRGLWRHEDACEMNPENQPSIPVMHACGHAGERKRFDNDPDGAKARAFEAGRSCTNCTIASYRQAQARRTPEQIAEQRAEERAAFGPGVALVDVLTGETYTT
jgi:hypothetical protein